MAPGRDSLAEDEMPPNIVMIVADDMRFDLMTDVKHASSLGTRFTNAHNSNPVCGPSRASILTGRLSHTTRIWGNQPPAGGYQLFDDHDTLPARLNDVGYTSGHFGKYLNGYSNRNASHVPPGWNRWWAITARGGDYYGYQVSDDGALRHYGTEPTDYLTDVINHLACGFIAATAEPFFAYITPVAPHRDSVAAPRHSNALQTEPFEPPSLNEDVTDKPRWVRQRDPLTPDELERQQTLRLQMRRCLLAVDDLVENVMTTLSNRGIVDDTIVIFCSDNGFLFGEHRLTGKEVPYLEATRMPLAIRWPSAMSGPNTDALISNVDFAPTLLQAAGADASGLDGRPLQPVLAGGAGQKAIYVEHHERGNRPAWAQVLWPNWSYTWYGTDTEELYNLDADPFQLRNVAERKRDVAERMRDDLRELMDGKPPPGMTEPP
jgi:N-acetylglucosamine-6-sulfatase